MSFSVRPLSFFGCLTQQFTPVLWICTVGVLLVLVTWLNIPFDVDGTDERITSAMAAIALIIGLTAAICIRYIFDTKASLTTLTAKPWAVVWLFPLAATIVSLPWLLSGVLADERTSIALSLFLWLLVTYGSLLLGFLLVPFVVVPLELIGRGLLALISGRHKEAGPMLVIGAYIALVTAFSFVGAFAIDNSLPGRVGWGNIIFALLGLPGSYTVENELLLWIFRIIAVVLIAVPLALAARNKQQYVAVQAR